VIVRRISIAMAAENVVVVAEVQVTDGGAGQGLSTDAVRAAAWARHREEGALLSTASTEKPERRAGRQTFASSLDTRQQQCA
jgi:hypothetical protein